MRSTPIFRACALAAVALAGVSSWGDSLLARPSMGGRGGGGGGGMARPAGGGMSRPAGGGAMARPAGGGGISRPNMSNVSRPSMGNAGGRPPAMSRPNLPYGGGAGRPSLGGVGGNPNLSRPGGGGSGGIQRPGGGNVGRPDVGNIARPQLPSGGNRPTVRPPGTLNPVTRPGVGVGLDRPGATTRPAIDRPSLGNITRPSLPSGPGGFERPSIGGDRPGIGGDRPGIGGDRPGIGGDRPGQGGGAIARPLPGRPGGGDRPGIGGDRPGIGGDRPGIGGDRPGQGGGAIARPLPGRPGIGGGDRPGIGGGDRPIIGGGGDRPRPEWPQRPGQPDRPIIGGGNNNNIGNNNNWNNININNRPGWGWGGGSGWWNNNWHDQWHDHCVNHHHNWYHGCWNNHWGYNWYAPVAWGAVGWGLNSWFGNTAAYYNPYYVQPVAASVAPYDYSQPVVVTNYITADSGQVDSSNAQPPPENQEALTQFDQGLAEFQGGNYQQALNRFDAALKKLPNDPVVHEVRALALFALGKFQPAAAALNALLATAPGMDWTTMSSLYGNPDDYVKQLRALEAYIKSNPRDPSANFVLAYHYLVTGHTEEAVAALRIVVREQPKDATASKMLAALAPPEQTSATAAATNAAPATPPASPDSPAAPTGPQTDLVGAWQATAGATTISLTIGEDSQFVWRVTEKDKPAVELKGDLMTTSDMLVLQNKEQGSMAGSVTSQGADQWQFTLAGAPPGEGKLSFERVKG